MPEAAGIDPCKFAGHSQRAGWATTATIAITENLRLSDFEVLSSRMRKNTTERRYA
jgi:hypothetical protein